LGSSSTASNTGSGVEVSSILVRFLPSFMWKPYWQHIVGFYLASQL
jgi:hypothetical protein